MKISSDELVLFARNTGELYETHKLLARYSDPPRRAWYNHVTDVVVPLYRKQVGWRGSATPGARLAAAAALREYYEQHIKEM